MSRLFSRRSEMPDALPRNTVITVAVNLAAASLVFLVWSVTTRSAARLAWLTSMATILAVVLSSWGRSAGMLAWAVRSQRRASKSGGLVGFCGGAHGAGSELRAATKTWLKPTSTHRRFAADPSWPCTHSGKARRDLRRHRRTARAQAYPSGNGASPVMAAAQVGEVCEDGRGQAAGHLGGEPLAPDPRPVVHAAPPGRREPRQLRLLVVMLP